jgi:effector-binding domain-containing protein
MYINWRTEKWRIEAGFAVPRVLPGAGEVVPSTLPACRALTTIHIGPYETLGDTWGALEAWAIEHHFERGDVMWEVYLTDPQAVPDPAQWQTKLIVPIKS